MTSNRVKERDGKWPLWRPSFLTEADHPWLMRLLDETTRLLGQRRCDFERRFSEPMTFEAPKKKFEAAKHQLLRMLVERPMESPTPMNIRRLLFSKAGYLVCKGDINEMGAIGSNIFRLKTAELALHDSKGNSVDFTRIMQSLYADIPSERIIDSLPQEISPTKLALATNASLVSRYLKRSHHVVIDIMGEARRVIRQAKFCGLLCEVESTSFGTRLLISGPLSVIRLTTYYGRSLAELVPFLLWCHRYRLIASCGEPPKMYRMMIMSGDPLPAALYGPSFDSKVEKWFAHDFGKMTSDWDLIREPEPIIVSRRSPLSGGAPRLIFPDFAAIQRTNPRNKWLIEIVGYWSPSYLAAKLEDFKMIGAAKVILCIDEKLNCDGMPLPEANAVIRYKRRIDAKEVLKRLNESEYPPVSGNLSPSLKT